MQLHNPVFIFIFLTFKIKNKNNLKVLTLLYTEGAKDMIYL